MSGSGPGAVNFTITAQDDVSSKFDKIKKRVEGLTKNVDKTQKSFGALALQDLSGLNKRVSLVADGAVKMAAGLLEAVEPLAVITSAASLAGVVRLSQAWADMGSKILFASQNIGMNTQQFQVVTNAGELAGVSIISMTSGLQALGQNMWNAVGGRDPAFMASMKMLHLNFRDTNGSIKSYSSLLPQIADKIQALHNPFAQAAVATELFGSAGTDMLPFLRQGAAGIAKLEAAAAANGTMTVQQINQANQLRESYTSLGQALDGEPASLILVTSLLTARSR